ncbi:hypothetical protein LSTR_LSTR013107 [Laodelphax striatellus]|uniref:FIST C-domain domain-containing protein n=1 Tax=Laodelphax striatellus TaxID=195883 RepID=A0A482XL26_LAOST|nr:hypothetical protein LSTR_LSTR013107 [Laodelphax striatellus]
MPGVHYDIVKFYVEDREICMESFPEKPPWFDLPVKCLLLLDCRMRNAQVIKSLRMFLDVFKVNDNTCLAVGGGRLRCGRSAPSWGRRRAADGKVSAHMYAVVVRGRNVAANSFMVKPHCATLEQIDAQLAAFASVVGPVTNGSERLAVMAQCIDRVRMDRGLENREAQIIGKHFPNVPLFGFVANGELGYSTDLPSNDEPPAKRMKSKPSLFINYQSTSLVILTFKTES